MMARSTLQRKAGYIDARPLTISSTKSSCYARPDHTLGSNAVQLSRHVGFTPDSGRMAATQRTDASGQFRTHAPQQICELGVNTPSLLDKTQAVSCRCHQPECPLSSGYPDFLGSFLDLSNPGIDLVLSDRTHRMINDDGLKVRHAKSLSG